VGFALQEATATGATWISRTLGLPVVRAGLVLRGPDFAFIVAEECSGMNSLLALLGLSLAWLAMVRGRIGPRLGVVFSVLPLVLIANVARVVLVLVIALSFGQDAATGFFHGASSIILFGVALLGVVLISRILGCRLYTAA
jgi:exosortase